MNKVIMIGRLVADPELRFTQSGKAVATYKIAVDRRFKQEGQPEADFFPCVAWGQNGEFASKYLRKGTKIAIEGRLQTRSWEQDGVKRYTTEIIVEQHEFCEKKTESSDNSSSDNDFGGYGAPPSYGEPGGGFSEISDEDGDLPF